jgi:hypothetical protein
MAQENQLTFFGYSVIAPIAGFFPFLFLSFLFQFIGLIISKTKIIKQEKCKNICLKILTITERITFMVSIYLVGFFIVFAVTFSEIHPLMSYAFLVIVQLGLLHAFRDESSLDLHKHKEMEEFKIILTNYLLFYPRSIANGVSNHIKKFIVISFALLILK